MSEIKLHFVGSDFVRAELTVASDGSSVQLMRATSRPGPDEEALESRWAEPVGQKEVALGRAVYEALDRYLRRDSDGGVTVEARLGRLEAFAGELISGAFPHLAHLVPPAHLGDA